MRRPAEGTPSGRSADAPCTATPPPRMLGGADMRGIPMTPRLILLPGLACDAELFTPQLPALADAHVSDVHTRCATLPAMAAADGRRLGVLLVRRPGGG